MKKYQVRAILLLILASILLSQNVSAYLDPGFGSMVWQMILAVGMGAAFAIKVYWQKLKKFFNRSDKNKIHEQ